MKFLEIEEQRVAYFDIFKEALYLWLFELLGSGSSFYVFYDNVDDEKEMVAANCHEKERKNLVKKKSFKQPMGFSKRNIIKTHSDG